MTQARFEPGVLGAERNLALVHRANPYGNGDRIVGHGCSLLVELAQLIIIFRLWCPFFSALSLSL